jgi:hypothetical protein
MLIAFIFISVSSNRVPELKIPEALEAALSGALFVFQQRRREISFLRSIFPL